MDHGLLSGKLVNQARPDFPESLQMFFTAIVLCSLRLFKLKTAGQTNHQEKASPLSCKTQIKFLAYLGLALNQSFLNLYIVIFCFFCLISGWMTGKHMREWNYCQKW